MRNRKFAGDTFLSNYENNILLKLVFACGIGYVLLHLTKIIVFMWGQIPVQETSAYFQNTILPNFAIQPIDGMLKKPWTLLTFMFSGLGFLKLFTSMIWLYVFGNVVQNLIGKKEIIPIFLLANIFGGIVFIALQAVWPTATVYFLGADAAILAFGIAALTLAPKYRFYMGENLAIPLWAVILIYLLLNVVVMFGSANAPVMGLMLSGAAFGFVYMKMVQSGFRPGNWWASVFNKITGTVTPKNNITIDVERQTASEIDAILDKINQKGMQSLSKTEKDILSRESKK